MQEQLTELQLKLAKEEENKGNVSKLNQDLNQVISMIISTPWIKFNLFPTN